MRTLNKATIAVLLCMAFIHGTVLGQHKLTLSMSNMGPHIGQRLQIRVLDKDNMK